MIEATDMDLYDQHFIVDNLLIVCLLLWRNLSVAEYGMGYRLRVLPVFVTRKYIGI